jgi:uncharacterized protein
MVEPSQRTGSPERRAALLLTFFMLFEGALVVASGWAHPDRLLAFLGFTPGKSGPLAGWIAAACAAAVYVGWSAHRLPSVRATLVRPSWLKLLVIPFSVTVAILEEMVFRKLLMNGLLDRGFGSVTQVMASAIAFGLAHGLWGVFARSWRAALAATIATGVLGGLLAVVFLLSARSLAPCIVAHFFIDLLIEPGLMLAAARGEMKRREVPVH